MEHPQELCESGGGRPGLPVPNSPYGLCGRNATLREIMNERQNEARENHSENHRMSAVFCIFGEGWGGGDINHVH